MYRIILILSITLFTAPLIADQAADKADFNRLYTEFNDLFANSKELAPIIEVAQKLYILAPIAYGNNHMNSAVVTYNLASLYDEKGAELKNADEQKAFQLYLEYFAILKELEVPQDQNYLEQYIAMVKAEYNANTFRSDKKYARTAIKLAKKLEMSDLELANLHYLIGNFCYKNSNVNDAKKLFQQAQTYYQNALGAEDYKVAEMNFYIARIDLSKDRHKAAEKSFLKVIEILDDKQDDNAKAMVLISHTSLVRLYSEIGEVDNATPHCIAYAMKSPANINRRRIPLFEDKPKFPNFLKRKNIGAEASVVVEYDVDANGFTTNITIHEAHNEKIKKAAIKAIKKYRYAPIIRDGKPAGIQGFQMTFSYRRI